jgi:putative ABC transport system ATP-binding protein
MNHPLVTLKHAAKRYETRGDEAAWALAEATCSMRAGEVTLLMGPSGSGKTTLLSLIGGLLTPTHGSVQVCGEELSSMPEQERQRFRREHIGFVYQSCNMLSTLTAQENVSVALSLRGSDTDEAADWLAMVGMESYAHQFPHELSGGQRQRVAIARALAGDPAVLLADEPTAALDSQHGRKVMALLRGAAHVRGTGVIVVTHDHRVKEYADRIIELADGRIQRIRSRKSNPVPPRKTTPLTTGKTETV